MPLLFKFYFCIYLVAIICLHELAHLGAAIWCKCGVNRVSFGFGKVLYSKKWKEIDWQIRAIPLGGECSLQDELSLTSNKTSFSNLRFTKKAIISLAGVTLNIIMGYICYKLSYLIMTYSISYAVLSEQLWLFGYLSLSLGITNALPLAPCLDGGYVVYVPILVKKYGLKKGYEVFASWVKKSFKIIMILNILSIPLFIYWLIKG